MVGYRVRAICLSLLASATFVLAQTEPSAVRVDLPSLRIDLSRLAPPPPSSKLVVTPNPYNFGEVIAGNRLYHTFAVNNDGTDLVIGSAEAYGPFRIVSGSPYALQPGEIGRITVEFSPQAAGAFSGLLVFHGEYSAQCVVAGAAQSAPLIAGASANQGSPPAWDVEIVPMGEGTSFQVRWRGVAGREYQVWYSDDLVNWTAAGAPVVATAGVTTFLDDGTVAAPAPVVARARFYRVGDSSAAIVGFCRVRLTKGETPLSAPFQQKIAAQGIIAGLTATTVTDVHASFQPHQFQFNDPAQPHTYVLSPTSGAHAGRWFLISDNDAQRIHIDDIGGLIDLTHFLRAGDPYIIYPLVRVVDIFGEPENTILQSSDQIFLWDVAAQNYEPPIRLEVIPPDTRLTWAQEATAVNNLPLFPGEGLVVKRSGVGAVDLLLSGNVPFLPVYREIASGNNLVGYGFPVPVPLSQADLLASGFSGGPMFSNSDKLYLYNSRRANFKTALWYNTLLDQWLTPVGELDPPRLELPRAGAFFLQRNQLTGFEWVQKPPQGDP